METRTYYFSLKFLSFEKTLNKSLDHRKSVNLLSEITKHCCTRWVFSSWKMYASYILSSSRWFLTSYVKSDKILGCLIALLSFIENKRDEGVSANFFILNESPDNSFLIFIYCKKTIFSRNEYFTKLFSSKIIKF